jgi:ATP-dependent NAD(P)H-hydrate dehydratase
MQLHPVLCRLVPLLEYSLHKGECGRILVVGGCEQYTGAPWYAGMAALKGGADLVTIVCTPDAALPIKSYSPALMVHGCLKPEEDEQKSTAQWTKHVDRADVLVVGCGLGLESPAVLTAAEQIIKRAISKGKKLVLDADMLTRLHQVPDLVRGYQNAILTPNAMEFRRLWSTSADPKLPVPPFDAYNAPNDKLESLDSIPGEGPNADTAYLANRFGGLTILRKGAVDIITNGAVVAHVGVSSSPRRVGGQGDVLAGLAALCFAWTDKVKDLPVPAPILAASMASFITRQASARAFRRKGRSMLTSDLLDEISNVLDEEFAMDKAKL